jgi:hypothetical protein
MLGALTVAHDATATVSVQAGGEFGGVGPNALALEGERGVGTPPASSKPCGDLIDGSGGGGGGGQIIGVSPIGHRK